MRDFASTWLCALAWACVGGSQTRAAVPFADLVQASWYAPAPGQFVNDPAFNDPARALGAPVGASLAQADNTSVVTLGGFGGSIVLGFSDPVRDDPCNPMGLDAIVFSNAFYVSADPTRRWGEAGVVEISADTNANGLPDDAWYVIASPALPSPPDAATATRSWDDDPLSMIPPMNVAWYPSTAPTPWYTTSGFELSAPFTSLVLVNSDLVLEDVRGLVDLTPTLPLGDTDADGVIDHPGADPADFYTRPDSPFIVGIDAGSAGGDAFDIAWAVDPATGEPAGLKRFDFIRLSTGPDALAGPLGELSTEIDAVARVTARPLWYDENGDGVVDAEDLYAARTDVNRDTHTDGADEALVRSCVRADELEDVLP